METGYRLRAPGLVMLLAVAAILLAIRLPFLPATLEDIDSVNFDLGVHDFNPIAHQPHPPGYPLYIALAKVAHAAWSNHAGALSLVSAVLGALTVAPLYVLLRQLTTPSAAALACVFTLFCPAVWFNSVRPMSDTTGFFFITLAQAALLVVGRRSSTRPGWLAPAIAGLLAGLALGTRVQAVFLVMPVLAWLIVRRELPWRPTAAGLAAGVGLWLLPVVVVSGGPIPLARSFGQLLADAAPAEPLLVRFRTAWVVDALRQVFVDPWLWSGYARAMLVAAGVGLVLAARQHRQTLLLAAILFLPYTLYHFFLQWTETLRYTIPTIPLIAVLAAVCIDRLGVVMLGSKTGVAALAIGVSVYVTAPALVAYRDVPSPPAQAMTALQREAAATPDAVVSGQYMFARYLPWLPAGTRVLLAPPGKARHQLGQYWRDGGRAPVLFLREPSRTMTFFFAASSLTEIDRWQWPAPVRPFMAGERPGDIQLVRMTPPDWFTESGFMLSSEAGQPDQVAREPHVMFIRNQPDRRLLSVNGTLPAGAGAPLTIHVDGREHWRSTLTPSFNIDTAIEARTGGDHYLPVTFTLNTPALFTSVALHNPAQDAVRPAEGFYLPEKDERRQAYRWIAPKAAVRVYLSEARARLRLKGRIPVEHYTLPLTLSLTWNGEKVGTFTLSSPEFDIAQEVTRDTRTLWHTLGVESSQSFVPDEHERTGDRRRLAVRVYQVDLEPPGAPSGDAGHLVAERPDD